MFRSSLIVAGAALLCSSAAAQHALDKARMRPVTTPIKHAGTVDVTTGKWTPPGVGNTKALLNVFNNTCTWSSGAYSAGYASCEDSYDEGRVPSSSDNTFVGTASLLADSQLITAIEIGYCTFNVAGAPDPISIEMAFWSGPGTQGTSVPCWSGASPTGGSLGHWRTNPLGVTVPPTPPANNTGNDGYFDLTGLALPGSTSSVVEACWIVTLDVSNTGFNLVSDGDGTFDNGADVDKFIWGKRFNNVSPIPANNGWLFAGEPSYPVSGCTYDIPCSPDPNVLLGGVPNQCGAGLGIEDIEWINADEIGITSTATFPPGNPSCLTSIAQYGQGSGCYWFNGYPTNPFTSYWLRLEGETGGGPPTFCTSKPTSIVGCVPTLNISSSNVPKGGALTVPYTAAPVPGGGNPGIFIYNRTGSVQNPINTGFGFICVIPFLRAGAFPQLPGGTVGNCNGGYGSFGPNTNFQLIVNGTPQILAGDVTRWQLWYRDSPNPGGANMTNAVGPITH